MEFKYCPENKIDYCYTDGNRRYPKMKSASGYDYLRDTKD
jgi:hypothetical protein